MEIKNLYIGLLLATVSIGGDCKKGSTGSGNGNPPDPTPTGPTIQYWLTKGDQTALLQLQTTTPSFGTATNAYTNIDVDSATRFQTVDGFGYTLTGGSAQLINQLSASTRATLLNELFGSDANSISVNYLRVSIGASDLSPTVFSYNDLPAGQTDSLMNNFNLSQDLTHVVPVLQQILAINPNIKIMGSPWSPPTWMKTNGASMGGSLLPAYYRGYARYFVRYIKAMRALGITIDAVTIQNEPQHGGNNPSMLMNALEQADFIKNHLGPMFRDSSITTKIIVWDHNCDNPNYPITVLNDANARQYINGSAFHLYGGDISALSTVRAAHPDKDLYFTEQWTSATGDFGGDLKWHLKNVIIGSMRNYSKNALEWNLAADQNYQPHTPGGCDQCKGALTIQGGGYLRNVSYYIVGHASKFVPAGSYRVSSSIVGSIQTAAFVTPAGKKVLIVLNEGSSEQIFNIRYKSKWAVTTLPAGAVATYTWN